ncbi:MAG: zinc ABC transporter substrate-binding protein [Alphaproteobacteria bacterium]|nr:zinc ABC transporter substrate-binding protein [Alphaproteobacteria bacterium]
MPQAFAEPKVVVSIQPIYSLTAGVMKGVGVPTLLIKGAQSPHTFALRPSEAKSLSTADIIVWIGPALESALEKPIMKRGINAKQLRLMDLQNLNLYPFRSEHKCTEHDSHNIDSYDPHIWMDIFNAKIIVTAIVDELSKVDPQNAATYNANHQALLKKLDQLNEEIKLCLKPFQQEAFMVFHDGYQYFEKAYNLKGLGAITRDPELQVSAKRLRDTQTLIQQKGVKCLFAEVQFQTPLVDLLAKTMNLKHGILDPYGANIKEAPENLYFTLMKRLTSDFAESLK